MKSKANGQEKYGAKLLRFPSFRFWSVSAVFFLAAPWWGPYLRELGGHNMFLQVDTLIILGVSIVAGLICQFFLPKGLIRVTSSAANQLKHAPEWLLFLALPCLLVGLYELNQSILHAFMNSADEHSCYFLAESLGVGKWYVTPHPLSDFFNVVHVGNRDGKWFSVYPPGWPLLMAVGLKFQIVDWMNPILSTVSVFFIYLTGKRLYGKKVSLLACLLLMISPFFLFTSASYFSHSTCLLTMSIFAYCYLRWRETQSNQQGAVWLVLAATAVGYGLMTRYLTMAAFAGPFILYHLILIVRGKEKLTKGHYLAAGIILAFMLIVFWQNFAVTGKPFKAPNRFDKSWERLGFRDFYTPLDGLIFIIARIFYLFDWVAPFTVFGFLLFSVRRRLESVEGNLFRYAFFLPAFAYFFYFSWGGNQYGPRYWFEGFPFLLLTLLDDIRYYWQSERSEIQKFLIGAMLVSLGASLYLFQKQADYFEQVSVQRSALYRHAESSLDEPSIVFIRGFLGQKLVMSEDDAIRNHPLLNSLILYAHDRGDNNVTLMNYYPERKAYRGYFDREKLEPRLEEIGK